MPTDTPDSPLLVHAARLYLSVNSPRLKAIALRALDSALSMSAEDNAPHHLNQVRIVAQAYPAARRDEMLGVIDEMAGSYQDGPCRHASLYSIPLIINTEQSTADLTLDEVNAICASARRLRLFTDDVDVQLLPWLTCTPPHLESPIERRRLVQQLAHVSAEEEMLCEMLSIPRASVDTRPLNMNADLERIAETAPAVEPGRPCVRYLTLAVVVELNGADTIMARLRLDPDRVNALDMWLEDIAGTLQRSGYLDVAARYPIPVRGAWLDDPHYPFCGASGPASAPGHMSKPG